LLEHGQQRGVLVTGPGRISRLAGQNGDVAADEQGVWVFGAGHRSRSGSNAGVLVTGPGRIPPASAVQWARPWRSIKVAGCSGPNTRSFDGQQRRELVTRPGGIPVFPVKLAR